MAECTIKKGGGGGVSSDEVTVTAGQVLKGQTYVGADTNDEVGTGTMAVQSAISFSAAAQSTTTIRISWKNPSKGPWTGVKIRMSTSGYPGVSGGTLKYTGYGSSAVAGATSYVDITGLTWGTMYYFTCYSYVTGLGDSTTSYNVSAKTKGTLLYSSSASSNPVSISHRSTRTEIYTNGIDFSNISEVIITFVAVQTITNPRGIYFQGYDSGNTWMFEVYIANFSITKGSTYTITFDLSRKTGIVKNIHFLAIKSDGSGASVDSTIHTIVLA